MCKSIDLSIVIVNWNVRDLLRACLNSILSQARLVSQYTWELVSTTYTCEILVVDSASSDDSAAMVEREFPAIRLWASDANLGYAGGNNLGIGYSRGQYVLLLNPDTVVRPGALQTMTAYLDAHPDVGVLGPRLYYPGGTPLGETQSSRRRFPTFEIALIESTFLEQWFPNHPALKRYRVLDQPDDATCEVDWVTGACLLVRKTVIDQVGLIDENYFMYSEELDWQKRIRQAGWRVVYLPQAEVIHYEGKSSEQVAAFRDIRFQKSKILYFKRHHGKFVGEMIRYWLLFHYLYKWSTDAAKWLLGHKRALRQQRMQMYVKVLQSRLRL
ncbi:MAG: glycosyltransferase family 2 protein [Anaerolineae bacterium]|nr:glycosyltransferase family 2 protein [Anaerolineae bacterium]